MQMFISYRNKSTSVIRWRRTYESIKNHKTDDDNRSWDELKDYIMPLQGAGMVITGAVGMYLLIADDATGIGVGDDVLIPADAAYISEGIYIFTSAFAR